MKKRPMMFLLAAFALAWPVVLFAEEAANTIPVVPVPQGHWWSGLASTVITAAIAGLTALIAWLTNNIKSYFKQKASEANTKESAAWYGTAVFLARMAVNAAKNKLGPGTATQDQVVDKAVKFLKDRLAAIDKDILDPVKNPKLDELLEGLVLSVYNLPFEVSAPLVQAPALKQP